MNMWDVFRVVEEFGDANGSYLRAVALEPTPENLTKCKEAMDKELRAQERALKAGMESRLSANFGLPSLEVLTIKIDEFGDSRDNYLWRENSDTFWRMDVDATGLLTKANETAWTPMMVLSQFSVVE